MALGVCFGVACERLPPKPQAASAPQLSSPANAKPAQPAPVGNRCYPQGKPEALAPAIVGVRDTGPRACRPLFDKNMRLVEAELRRKYPQHLLPSRTFVSFDCDPVAMARNIALEHADEQDGELLLLELFGDADQLAHELVALRVKLVRVLPSQAGYGSQTGDTFAVAAAHSSLSRSALDVEFVRTAAAATIREVGLADSLGATKGVSGNHRVHMLLSFRGLPLNRSGELASYARHADGLNESTPQMDSAWLPLQLATEPILKLLTGIGFAAPAADFATRKAEQNVLAARFRATFPTAEPWLRELYLALAAPLGDARLVPPILESALHGDKREQELAVDALAQITGWDPRRDLHDTQRDLNAVAASYAAECSR